MTKLEEEIKLAIIKADSVYEKSGSVQIEDIEAKAAAEVAKKYVEMALESCAVLTNTVHTSRHNWPYIKQKWLKENGII